MRDSSSTGSKQSQAKTQESNTPTPPVHRHHEHPRPRETPSMGPTSDMPLVDENPPRASITLAFSNLWPWSPQASLGKNKVDKKEKTIPHLLFLFSMNHHQTHHKLLFFGSSRISPTKTNPNPLFFIPQPNPFLVFPHHY